jgi:hypothetical protein
MIKNNYKLSYWCNNGRFQTVGDTIKKFIPVSGPCGKNQPKLEALRKAINCYYDLFNNGLCNRAREFRSVFGFSPRKLYHEYSTTEIDFQHNVMNLRLNLAMDRFILDAALECGITVIEDSQEPKVETSKVPEIRHAMENLKANIERFAGLLDGTASNQEQTLKEIEKMSSTFSEWTEPLE